MSKPQFWSAEKKEAMLAMIQDTDPEEHELLPVDDPRIAAISPKSSHFQRNIRPFDEAANRPVAYQIRIDLEGYRPPIWRRLIIPAGLTYEQLHVDPDCL